MPEEIVLQLTHRDVNLSFFKTRKKEILALRAGEELDFENHILYTPKEHLPVAQLSQKMQSDIAVWEKKNYFVVTATIRFIVAWRPKEAPKTEGEHAVILLDLKLQKRQ